MDEIAGLGEIPEIGEQGLLLDVPRRAREVAGEVANPIVHVRPIVSHPQLDHEFDYLVPKKFDSAAVVGARVVVELGSRRVPGFIVRRDSQTRSGGHLRPLCRVVSSLPVLTAEVYELAREVSRRWACTVADVLRLAVPERHARVEKEFLEAADAGDTVRPDEAAAGPWAGYDGGPELIGHLNEGKKPAAVVAGLPGRFGNLEVVSAAAQATLHAGGSVLIVFPTQRLAHAAAEYLHRELGQTVAVASSEDPQKIRYENFLLSLSGRARILVGTRAACWWPVPKLGLVIVADDVAHTLREVRAPYSQAFDVLRLRAELEDAAFISYAPYNSEAGAQAVREGAGLIEGTAPAKRSVMPRVSAAEQWNSDDSLRIPAPAFTLARQGLAKGPVLFVVPRSGYIPQMACENCREVATCNECGGDLSIPHSGRGPHCTVCGSRTAHWRCRHCGYGRMRARRIGSHRTAEEIGRAFPGVGIILSGASSPDGVVAEVSDESRIVVSTPGAEPSVPGGYAAAIILDSRYLLGAGLDAETLFVRRIARVITRVRPAREGGHVMLAGHADLDLVACLAQWDHGERARRSLEERAQLALPPASRWLAVSGELANVRTYLGMLRAELRSKFAAGKGEAEERRKPAEHGRHDENPDPEENIEVESLLVGGVHSLVPGIALLGPVPGQRRGEYTVYLRTDRVRGAELTARARRTYGGYRGSGAGAPLRLEVDPLM